MTYRITLQWVISIGCAVWMLGVVPFAHPSDFMMKAPKVKRAAPIVNQGDETSSVSLAFLGVIRLYQKRVSPIGGDRCGFWPSCSAYGYSAVREQGPLLGLIMIGDRLTRCNIWKEEGPDYFLLPSGKLYDPPSKNLLFEK
jgi:putative membrane protein insertion efficiency factor